MSTRPVHEVAAATNIRTARALLFADVEHAWATTVLYYVGVQAVQAALSDFGECAANTGDRCAAIHARWLPAAAPHRKLKQLSETWRYKGVKADARQVELAERWCRDLFVAIGERWPE